MHRVRWRLPDPAREQRNHTLGKTRLEKQVLPKYRLFKQGCGVAGEGTGVMRKSRAARCTLSAPDVDRGETPVVASGGGSHAHPDQRVGALVSHRVDC